MKRINAYICLMAGLYLSMACSSFAQTVTPIPLVDGKGHVDLPPVKSEIYYSIEVPEGTGQLLVEMADVVTGVELYLHRGSVPTTKHYDRAWKGIAPNKWLVYANPLPGTGTWYIVARNAIRFSENIGGEIDVSVRPKMNSLFSEALSKTGPDIRIPVRISEFLENPIRYAWGEPYPFRTWAIVHGRVNSADDFILMADVLAGLLDEQDSLDQVLLVDWSLGADDNGKWWTVLGMLRGGRWIAPVGATAKEMLFGIGAIRSRLNLIGHSWGSYVCYEISNLLATKITPQAPGAHLLVALDPAAEAKSYNESLVSFNRYASHSWGFVGRSYLQMEWAGSQVKALTAANSFAIYFASIFPWEIHFAVHAFFTMMLGSTSPDWVEYFQPDGLVSHTLPWNPYTPLPPFAIPPNPIDIVYWQQTYGFEGVFKGPVSGMPASLDEITFNIYNPKP